MATRSIPHRWKYDVFVSFRGEDIRKNFMDHMFNDFKQKGIHAFRDDNELPKGEEISPQLYKAIEESRFLIVIFSKNYASSSWCLRELVKILECKQIEDPKHEVQIIFYDAKPDVVRKQKRSYAEAFINHEISNKTEVDKWRKALSMAANLSAWDLQDMTNGYEYKFIDFISKEILKKLCDGPLHVGEYLVGIDFHFEKLNLSCFVRSDKVNMIGICGISGIGKTTLAKAIYNLMNVHFEGSCFCEDVKEVTKRQGLIQVQLHMIRKIMKIEDLKISSVGEGIMVIKKMMSSKPILLVLDDVDDHEQLDSLAGSASWFCPGSLIIFTGKDKQLLRSHRMDGIHDMDFLDEDQSLELFYSISFEEKDSSRGFKEVAKEVVKYVQGHPLALKVLGRFLYGKTVGQWVSELDQLKVHPNKEIQRVLRLSYDGLNLHQQNILLDIACSFIGVNSDFAASVLDCCNFFADTNMKVLVDKSLITLCSDMSLQMHDLIKAMAREIIHEESIMTGKQRRLWNSSQVYNVLSEKNVPIIEAVEVLVIFLEKSSQKVHIDAKAFAHMKKLRILKIYAEEEFDQKLELKYLPSDFLSNELRLFCWHGYPFKYLPLDFYPENIVAIDLSYSHIKQLWTTPKCLRRLKVLKLRYCRNLTTTPDFTEITNLEELDLEGCVNMVTVHPSIGMLKKFVVLNMKDCKWLQIIPSRVEMDSLHGGQERIHPRLWTSFTAAFGFIWKQQHPQRSVWSSLAGLHMLKSLNLSYCNLVQVPESIGGLLCLKNLELNGNDFTSLPGYFSQLSHLQRLKLDGCKKLEVLPKLPPSLRVIDASHCTSLREVSEPSNCNLTNLEELSLEGCVNLSTLDQSIVMLKKLVVLNLKDCRRVRSYFGCLYYLSNELCLFYWHGCPFKYLPSNFYPENIVAIDLSYSHIKQLWTTPKCLRRLKVLKLRYCCNLTTTPDFSEITNLEELSLEGCVNMVTVHPSIGMLKKLVVLSLKDCTRVRSFPSKVEMDSLHVLNLSGCLKVDQLPEALGRIKTLTELHIDRTAITELPSFVSSLINLESLSFGGQGRIQPRWWTSILAPFGLLSKQQHPQRSVSLAGLHMLKSLDLSYCNLLEVPESIGGLSYLEELYLSGNNFTSLPGSLSQLSNLKYLHVDGCKKLEVLPELPPSLCGINASDCPSLREVPGSSKASQI